MACTPHIQPLQEDEDGTSDALVATQSWLRRRARQSGKAGRQGGVAG